MSLMKFLCGLFPGRCGCETAAPEPGTRTQATDVQPNAPEKTVRSQGAPPSPEESEELPSPS